MAVDGLVSFVAPTGLEESDQPPGVGWPELTSGLDVFVCCVEREFGEAAATHGTSSSPWTEQGSPL